MVESSMNASDHSGEFLPHLYCEEAMAAVELVGGRRSCVTPASERAPRPTVWAEVQQPVRQRVMRVPPAGQRAVKFPRLATDRPGRYSESEMASAAEMMRKLQLGEDCRRERVERVREAVAGSDYENEMKLEIAVERLLEEIS